MNIVVDTSVWSLVLRRKTVDERDPHVSAFRRHLDSGDGLFLVGPILQELLSGLTDPSDAKRLLRVLDHVPLLPLVRSTFIRAAQFANACRVKGIQAGHVDFTIAAACFENKMPLLTRDKHFALIAQHCPLTILLPGE